MHEFVKAGAGTAPAATAPVGQGTRSSAGKTLCRFENVSFSYPGGVEALSNVSFDVEAGSNLSIVGPSGCGKSTLLYVLANLLQPSSGNTQLIDLDPGRHQLSMLFQKDTLLPWLTVAENISLFGTFRKSQRRRVRDNVDWLLSLARLENIRGSYPYQLSGGMRRRVAFLSAIAPIPQILLLDEPFSSIDQPTQIAIHEDVRRISAELGITMILVTHDLSEAISLGSEVMVMTHRPGRIRTRVIVDQSPDTPLLELRERPEFLRQFRQLWHSLAAEIAQTQKAERDI